MATEDVDVIVVGGGPGGSSVGNLLAQAGWRVRLFERTRFPRYHLGESLQAGTQALWALLGATERLSRAGFVVKRGASYRWGQRPEPWSVAFDEEGGFPSAYQVERDRFDQLMLECAVEQGVDARMEHTVLGALEEGGRVTGVRVRGPSGADEEVRARFVVDASGQDRLFEGRFPPRQINRSLGHAALWTYFKGARRLEGREGDIFIAAFAQGWFWFIPQSDGVTSVGAVVGEEFEGRTQGGASNLQELFDRLLEQCPHIRDRVRVGTQVAEVRSMANWSYTRESATAPGLLAVGDAARFVDPILSAGVGIATMTAHAAAVALNTALRHPAEEAAAIAWFDRWTRYTIEVHLSMAEYWYDAEGSEEDYFWHSRRLVDPSSHMTARRAFVFATAGYVGNLAHGAERRFDAENLRFLGVRAPERFHGVEPADAHRLQDEIDEVSALHAEPGPVAGSARVTDATAPGAPGPLRDLVLGLELVRVPEGLRVPPPHAGTLFASLKADGGRACFIEIGTGDGPAFRRVGALTFSYRSPGDEGARRDAAGMVTTVTNALTAAGGPAQASPEAAVQWLLRWSGGSAAPVALRRWSPAPDRAHA